MLALSKRRVVYTNPRHKPVISRSDRIQKVGWRAHAHSLAISVFADAERSTGECLIGLRFPSPVGPCGDEWFDLIEVNAGLWRHRSKVNEIAIAHKGHAASTLERCGAKLRRILDVDRLCI